MYIAANTATNLHVLQSRACLIAQHVINVTLLATTLCLSCSKCVAHWMIAIHFRTCYSTQTMTLKYLQVDVSQIRFAQEVPCKMHWNFS